METPTMGKNMSRSSGKPETHLHQVNIETRVMEEVEETTRDGSSEDPFNPWIVA